MEKIEETNRFKRAWIWFWFNDVTRVCCLLGLPLIPLVTILGGVFGWGEYLRDVSIFAYSLLLIWMFIDNDYSNLRRIGMTEYRKKI